MTLLEYASDVRRIGSIQLYTRVFPIFQANKTWNSGAVLKIVVKENKALWSKIITDINARSEYNFIDGIYQVVEKSSSAADDRRFVRLAGV